MRVLKRALKIILKDLVWEMNNTLYGYKLDEKIPCYRKNKFTFLFSLTFYYMLKKQFKILH
jgi:hypothetical protein